MMTTLEEVIANCLCWNGKDGKMGTEELLNLLFLTWILCGFAYSVSSKEEWCRMLDDEDKKKRGCT